LVKRWKGVGLIVLGILIFLLAVYLGTSVYGNTSPPSWLLVMGFVGLAVGYVGGRIAFEWAPPGGESVGFGNCTICGETNVAVASRDGVNYCGHCYRNGAAQAYFDGMDRQSRGSDRTQPQIEERPPTQPQATKEIIKEREVIHRETIVKIRCGHCHRLFEEEKGSCPNCGAPV
jgi:hypothetical protein